MKLPFRHFIRHPAVPASFLQTEEARSTPREPRTNSDKADPEESLRVLGFNEMDHFMHDHIFEHVAWFLDQLGVDPDRPALRVAASPFGLHPLQKVAANLDTDSCFPLADQLGDCVVEQSQVPPVHNAGSLVLRGSAIPRPMVIDGALDDMDGA
jgi:hypothetical protein